MPVATRCACAISGLAWLGADDSAGAHRARQHPGGLVRHLHRVGRQRAHRADIAGRQRRLHRDLIELGRVILRIDRLHDRAAEHQFAHPQQQERALRGEIGAVDVARRVERLQRAAGAARSTPSATRSAPAWCASALRYSARRRCRTPSGSSCRRRASIPTMVERATRRFGQRVTDRAERRRRRRDRQAGDRIGRDGRGSWRSGSRRGAGRCRDGGVPAGCSAPERRRRGNGRGAGRRGPRRGRRRLVEPRRQDRFGLLLRDRRPADGEQRDRGKAGLNPGDCQATRPFQRGSAASRARGSTGGSSPRPAATTTTISTIIIRDMRHILSFETINRPGRIACARDARCAV